MPSSPSRHYAICKYFSTMLGIHPGSQEVVVIPKPLKKNRGQLNSFRNLFRVCCYRRRSTKGPWYCWRECRASTWGDVGASRRWPMMSEKIRAQHLSRKAILYIRQSSGDS